MAQPPVVGIDIGSQLMKAVELTVSPKEGLAVTALAVAPTPPGVLQNGILTDPNAMAVAVKQMLKDAGIRAKRAVGCIAGQASVVVRIIEVPRMTPAELTETMKWEVERHVPFAPTEVEMDYQPLPLKDDGTNEGDAPNMSVLLAVAQREMVGYYVDALLKAGLEPVAIDIEPLAAGRALLDIDDNGLPVRRAVVPVALPGGDFASEEDMSASSAPRETVAVVNIGASNTDISIFEDGMLIFPRSLALAGESLTRAISESLDYTIDQAERLKIESGQVLMERLNDYSNQQYPTEAVEFPYGQPEEDFSNLRPVGLPDSGPLSRSPFDSGPLQARTPFDSGPLGGPTTGGQGTVSDRLSSGPLGGPSSGGLASGPLGGFNNPIDLERTQPIQRSTLDLARRPNGTGTAPLRGASGDDGGFGEIGMGGDHIDVGAPQAPDELTIQIFDAMLPVLRELATELRRSLDYYRSRAAGRNVDRLILCGGTASLPNIDKFLEQEMLVPIQIANPMRGLSVTSKSFDASYLQSIAPLFTIAVGLAERQAVFAANPEPKVRAQRPPAGTSSGGTGTGGKLALPKINFNLPFGKRGASGNGTPGAGGTTLPPVS